MRPSRKMSKSMSVPGIRATRRFCPARFTADKSRSKPVSVAVNQTSRPSAENLFVVSEKIYDRAGATIVSLQGVVEECHHVALGRNPGMADPAPGLVKHFAHGIFQPVPATHIAHYSEVAAIRRPIRPLHVLEHLSWRSASQRCAGQRTHVDPRSSTMTVEGDCHFA